MVIMRYTGKVVFTFQLRIIPISVNSIHAKELSKRLKIDIQIDIGLMAATPAVKNAILLDLSI